MWIGILCGLSVNRLLLVKCIRLMLFVRMVAHKCQPSFKDQAHHTSGHNHTTFRNVVWCRHEKSSVAVVSVWCAWSLDEGWHLRAIIRPTGRRVSFKSLFSRLSFTASILYRFWDGELFVEVQVLTYHHTFDYWVCLVMMCPCVNMLLQMNWLVHWIQLLPFRACM